MTEQWRKSTHSLTESTCVEWHKSSYSGHDQCVEMGVDGTTVMVRDSKDVGQQPLSFTGGSWTAFVQGVKEGEFDGGQATG